MFCKQIMEDDIERTKANLRNNHLCCFASEDNEATSNEIKSLC